VRAFTVLDLDRARLITEARGAALPAVARIAVGLKDIFDTADFPTEYGSPIYIGYRPRRMPRNSLVRRAGGMCSARP
jgi:Asp-tRNA(Asn)/Glu-tRNA(Gln) amidotransferase A subunit family amidase